MVTRLILLASILCLFQGCETPPTIKSMAVEIAGETYQLELRAQLFNLVFRPSMISDGQ